MEEEDVCKVCRSPGEPNDPLFFPCNCRGSVRYVHQTCLEQWMRHSNSKKCEICGYHYQFTPTGLLSALSARLLTILHYILVIFCWLVLLPMINAALFSFDIYGSHDIFFEPAQSNASLGNETASQPFIPSQIYSVLPFGVLLRFASYWTYEESDSALTYSSLAYALQVGQLIFAINVIAFVGASLLAAYLRQIRSLLMVQRQLRQAEDDQHADEQEDQQPIENGQPHHNQDGGIDQNLDEEPLALGDQDENGYGLHYDAGVYRRRGHGENHDEPENNNAPDERYRDQPRHHHHHHHHHHQDELDNPIDFLEAVDYLAARMDDMMDAAHVHNDAEDRLDEELDADNQFDEENDMNNILGNQGEEDDGGNENEVLAEFGGNAFGLAEPGEEEEVDEDEDPNPLTIAELVGLKGSYTDFAWNLFAIACYNAAVLFFVIFVPNVLGRALLLWLPHLPFRLRHWISEPALSILIGYMIASSFVGIFLLFISFKQRFRPVSPLERLAVSALAFAYTCVKIVVLSFAELILYPMLAGIFMRCAAAPIFGMNIRDCLAVLLVQDVMISCAVSWLSGFAFFMFISYIIRTVRHNVRKDFLWFLIDPEDPTWSPMREMVFDPLRKHARRIALSVLLYCILTFFLIGLPFKILAHLDLLPRLEFSRLSVSLEPYYAILGAVEILERLPIREMFSSLVLSWLYVVGGILGLNDYIYGPPDSNRLQPLDTETLARIKPPYFGLRCLALTALFFFTMTDLTIIAIAIPTIAGRYVTPFFLPFPAYDGVSLANGASVMGLLLLMILSFSAFVANVRSFVSLPIATQLSCLAKAAVLYPILFGVIPLLAGVCVQYSIFQPIFVSPDQTMEWSYQGVRTDLTCQLFRFIFMSSLLSVKAYVLGLMLLYLAYRSLSAYNVSTSWAGKYDRVFNNGITNIEPAETFQELILPAARWFTIRLLAPYVIIEIMTHYFGFVSVDASGSLTPFGIHSHYIYHYVTLFLTMVKAVLNGSKVVSEFHEHVRNQNYRIGQTLVNHEQN